MRSQRVLFLLFLTLVLAAIASASDPTDPIKKAVEKSTLDQAGTRPFHLNADVAPSFDRDKDSGRTGKIEIWWSSPTQWRREVRSPEFHQIDIFNGPREWQKNVGAHLLRHEGKSERLFVNRRGRAFSANKLCEKQLHPLLHALGIPRGGFHSLRHGAASALLADGATPAVVQRQLRDSDARITLGIYGHIVGDEQRTVVQNRSKRLVN